jgi:5-methylcytosine-specific restriction endonuclease McrA
MSITWSRRRTACIRCKRDDRKHMARGLCVVCYMEYYNKSNPLKIRRYKHAWYVKNGGKLWAKLQREQQQFDGIRDAIMQRDGHKCVKCGSSEKLCVHHKDGNGRNVPTRQKNNNPENLETLCRRCHIKEHRAALLAARTANQSQHWSPLHKLEFCIDCLRSDRKHESGGRCFTCAAQHRKKLKRQNL